MTIGEAWKLVKSYTPEYCHQPTDEFPAAELDEAIAIIDRLVQIHETETIQHITMVDEEFGR